VGEILWEDAVGSNSEAGDVHEGDVASPAESSASEDEAADVDLNSTDSQTQIRSANVVYSEISIIILKV